MRKKKMVFDFKYRFMFVILFIVLSIGFLLFSFNKNMYLNEAINSIFFSMFDSLSNNKDIIGTNINEELKLEIDALKKLSNIKNILSDYEVINGVVILRNPSYWLNEIVVNKGRDNGIEEGMAVVVSEGLVGYVSALYDTSCRVKLITNSSYNNTSIKIKNIYLILEYDDDSNLIVNQLDNSNSIKEGDVVLTSGLTDKYPSGITIGYVSKIENNIFDTGKKLYISLYYDINDLRYVSFLKRLV